MNLLQLKALKLAIDWSREQFTGLPWRQDRSLYRTLVSELMLQQTVVGTVQRKFPAFIKQFPSLHRLAQASLPEVLEAWQGLGYYRRARLLHQLASQEALSEAQFPLEEKELLKLPAIGPYTANALRAIGANLPSLALDTNLQRVLSRFMGEAKPMQESRFLFLYPDFYKDFPYSYRDFHEAIMDVGRVFCKQSSADCAHCPLQKGCVAGAGKKNPLAFGKKASATPKITELELVRILLYTPNKDALYLYQKQDQEWLRDQWEPLTFVQALPANLPFAQYPKWDQSLPLPSKAQGEFLSSITKYRFRNFVYAFTLKDVSLNHQQLTKKFPRLCEVPLTQLAKFPLSSALRKAIKTSPWQSC